MPAILVIRYDIDDGPEEDEDLAALSTFSSETAAAAAAIRCLYMKLLPHCDSANNRSWDKLFGPGSFCDGNPMLSSQECTEFVNQSEVETLRRSSPPCRLLLGKGRKGGRGRWKSHRSLRQFLLQADVLLFCPSLSTGPVSVPVNWQKTSLLSTVQAFCHQLPLVRLVICTAPSGIAAVGENAFRKALSKRVRSPLFSRPAAGFLRKWWWFGSERGGRYALGKPPEMTEHSLSPELVCVATRCAEILEQENATTTPTEDQGARGMSSFVLDAYGGSVQCAQKDGLYKSYIKALVRHDRMARNKRKYTTLSPDTCEDESLQLQQQQKRQKRADVQPIGDGELMLLNLFSDNTDTEVVRPVRSSSYRPSDAQYIQDDRWLEDIARAQRQSEELVRDVTSRHLMQVLRDSRTGSIPQNVHSVVRDNVQCEEDLKAAQHDVLALLRKKLTREQYEIRCFKPLPWTLDSAVKHY